MVTKICCKCCYELDKYIQQLKFESVSFTVSPWLRLHFYEPNVFVICDYDSASK